ncbi:MAG: hypothetical protein U9R00_01550, partial [Patescibacteria group bacterium]|nr:hypothetical protein [Patescibacteria group bacterium]
MKNNFKILLISLLLLGGLSLVNAWTGPSSSPTAGNTKSPLTASDSNQYKEGKLAINKSSSPILYDLEVVGNILASGFATSGGINMTGDIKTDSLTHSSSNQVKVCVTSSGVLEKCTTTPVVLSYGGMSSAQAFSIPLNVKNDKITVEMWGAGAGGGKVSVGNYSEVAAQDGGDSYFAKGSTFSVIANGGDANKDGGDYIDPTNSNLT